MTVDLGIETPDWPRYLDIKKRCRERGQSSLDIDDVASDHPLALGELRWLRFEVLRLKAEADDLRASTEWMEADQKC